jgi:hypothetical protein
MSTAALHLENFRFLHTFAKGKEEPTYFRTVALLTVFPNAYKGVVQKF